MRARASSRLRLEFLRARLRLELLRNRLRLRWVCWIHPGVEVDAAASPNLGSARFVVAPGGRIRIGPGVVTEGRRGWLSFVVGAGATIEIGADSWLRTEIGPIHLVAFDGALLRIGPEGFLNGCHVSAKERVETGRRAWIGPGTRIFDADQHDLDDRHPERSAPVEIGDYAWIASDATLLRGVKVGAHSVVGARSVVLESVPPHTVVVGAPARPVGEVGDRSRAR
jgi:acetyltransferase-like isoleucine patch superfamily enzyme